MKILITNNHLANVGGTEKYVHDLAFKLAIDYCHEVFVFTFHKGLVSKQIEKFAKVFSSEDIDSLPIEKRNFDLILANHNSCVAYLIEKHVSGVLIQTCHGYKHILEQPYLHERVHAYVGISPEVQRVLELTVPPSKVHRITAGVDLRKFKNTFINSHPRYILSLSQDQPTNDSIKKVADEFHLIFLSHNKFNNPEWNIENKIMVSDIVISIGRGAVEGLAAGKNVIVLDNREYNGKLADGMITEDNIDFLSSYNFSGRATKIEWDEGYIASEISRYTVANGFHGMEFIKAHYNIDNSILQYLKIYQESV
jgi:glycosyltransferase involved in cell wall biosynthesis